MLCRVTTPAGYEVGPDATVRATQSALAELDGARGVVLVEGVSDQIAVDAAAQVIGVDLAGVVVMPIGGAHAIARALGDLDARLVGDVPVAVLCDEREAPYVERALADSTRLGVRAFVCRADLEDELIRAAGIDRLDALVARVGDTAPFARMSAQPAWSDEPHPARFRRFVGAGAGRKHRYAAAIPTVLGPDEIPAPLAAAIAHVSG